MRRPYSQTKLLIKLRAFSGGSSSLTIAWTVISNRSQAPGIRMPLNWRANLPTNGNASRLLVNAALSMARSNIRVIRAVITGKLARST
jgi:hypothetical protein